MNMKWVGLMGLGLATFLFAGCVGTLSGERKMGVPFIKDTIEGRYERPPSEVWTAAKDVLRYNGTLESEDLVKGTLQAVVNARNVWVKVEELDQKVTRVVVQARTKGGASDLELSSEIDKQIAIRLATGNLTPAGSTFPQSR